MTNDSSLQHTLTNAKCTCHQHSHKEGAQRCCSTHTQVIPLATTDTQCINTTPVDKSEYSVE